MNKQDSVYVDNAMESKLMCVLSVPSIPVRDSLLFPSHYFWWASWSVKWRNYYSEAVETSDFLNFKADPQLFSVVKHSFP